MIAESAAGRGTPQSVGSLRGLARTYYLEFIYGPEEAEAPPDPFQSNASLQQLGQESRLNPDGERALRYALEALSKVDPVDRRARGETLVELGDWYLIGGATAKANQAYREGWKELVAAGNDAAALLQAPRRLAYRPPSASIARARPNDPGSYEERYVETRFKVLADGKVDDVETVGTDAPQSIEKATQYAVRKARYAPRLENGEPVATEGVTLRERVLVKAPRNLRTRAEIACGLRRIGRPDAGRGRGRSRCLIGAALLCRRLGRCRRLGGCRRLDRRGRFGGCGLFDRRGRLDGFGVWRGRWCGIRLGAGRCRRTARRGTGTRGRATSPAAASGKSCRSCRGGTRGPAPPRWPAASRAACPGPWPRRPAAGRWRGPSPPAAPETGSGTSPPRRASPHASPSRAACCCSCRRPRCCRSRSACRHRPARRAACAAGCGSGSSPRRSRHRSRARSRTNTARSAPRKCPAAPPRAWRARDPRTPRPTGSSP